MSLTLLPAEWQSWLRHNIERGTKPADLLRNLTTQGHFAAQVALAAIEEARRSRTALVNAAGPSAPTLPGSPTRALPWLDTQRRWIDAAQQRVSLRVTLERPGIAVLDDLLDAADCACLCSLGRQGAVGASPAPGQGHAALKRLAQRLSALVSWPLSHFAPLQIRRLRLDDDSLTRADSPGQAGRGGPLVGRFVVCLDAPADSPALTIANAGGLRLMPQAGMALWLDAARGDHNADPATLASVEVSAAEPPWVALAWLHQQGWQGAAAA